MYTYKLDKALCIVLVCYYVVIYMPNNLSLFLVVIWFNTK